MDELTLGEREAGTLRFFINTASVRSADGGLRSWTRIGTQCVNPSTKASEGAEWENLCYEFGELNEVNVRDLVGSSRANTLWKLIDAQNIGDTFFPDVSKIEQREQVHEELSNALITTTISALSEALRKVEGTEADYHVSLVSSFAVTRRLAPSSARMFSCVLSGVYRSALRTGLSCLGLRFSMPTVSYFLRRGRGSSDIRVANVACE